MRSVWRIWLECRLYIAGKGEDPSLNPAEIGGTPRVNTDSNPGPCILGGWPLCVEWASSVAKIAPQDSF